MHLFPPPTPGISPFRVYLTQFVYGRSPPPPPGSCSLFLTHIYTHTLSTHTRYPLALLAEAHGYFTINLAILVSLAPLFFLRY